MKKKHRAMELLMGRMLRIGVFASCGVALAGGVLYLYQNAGQTVDFSEFSAAMAVESLGDIWRGLLALDAVAVIQTSLVILLATPILRVLFAVLMFAIERDYMYVLISLLVLGIIIFNIFTGA